MDTLRGRNFISLRDFSKEELFGIMDLAVELKKKQKTGKPHHLLPGKILAMIFEKPSTRTRVSFETGIYQLGGTGQYLGRNDLQLGRGETIPDTAKVLGRYVDGIMARTYAHQTVLDLAEFSGIPVINGLTDLLHPCQALTDYFTVREEFGDIGGRKIVYLGDGGNNMVHSLLIGAAIFGMDMSVASPAKYQPNPAILAWVKAKAATTGSAIVLTENVDHAVGGAHVLYTDVWMSMGQTEDKESKMALLRPYQINVRLLAKAAKDAIVLHCLPAHREEELSSEVMDGRQSRVFDQAENRLHVQKALMAMLMTD